jgi:hypothetical protein
VLYVFGFERIAVVMSDLYFLDPNPGKGQEGAERGVRLELRAIERGAPRGSIYSATPISVERPIWRVDLLETADGPPGSFDRTHHHPRFREWEPGRRNFVEALSADPVGWLAARLADPESVLADAGLQPGEVDDADVEAVRAAAPEIVDTLRRLLERVHAGELGQRPGDESLTSIRAGWL